MALHREGDAEETTAKKRHFTTSSETLTPSSLPPPLPTLPFDVVVEILCRLPVKPLLQLRCICKSWKALISDPKFAKKHLRCSPTDFTRHHIILSYMNPSREFLLTDFTLPSVFTAVIARAAHLENPPNYQIRLGSIVGSCDGILCLDIVETALLWNPSTQRFKILPSLENPQLEGCYTIYGFGYDHFANSYKVVAIFCYESDSGIYKAQVKIHTLGTDFWRRIQEFPLGVPFESGKFVSGTINWLASTDDSNWVIISLDLGKECYQELLQPVASYGEVVDLTLGVLRDCLCMSHRCSDMLTIDIWLMKEYGNKDSWTKLFSIREGGPSYTKIIHMLEDDDQVLLELEGNLVLCNSTTATSKTIQIQNIDGLQMNTEIYVESLISPCSLF